MKTIVISLGGSLIVPEKIDKTYLINFREILKKHYKNTRFVLVCGGGTIARKYIDILRKQKKSEKELSLAGIRATRMNAKFVMQIFGKESNDVLPMNMREIKNNLHKNKVIICGALRYAPRSTSDGTAAKLAKYLNSEFINMTNVKGLFTSNPKTNPNAKFISSISWKEFEKRANKTKHKAGQHFVLDQSASKIIKKEKIKTYIIDSDLKNLNNLIDNKNFVGTTIYG
jgi:uridylate kinase